MVKTHKTKLSFLALCCMLCAFSAQGLAAPVTTLQDTLRFAFGYSPNVKAAQESRMEAVHGVRVAEAGYYPTIGLWAGIGISQSDDAETRARGDSEYVVGTGNITLQASQTLWDGGATSSRVRKGNAELNYRAWQLMDSATSLAYSAVSAHADVLRRRTLVALARNNVKENRRILSMIHTRTAHGLVGAGDADLARGRLARAEATLTNHEQGLENAYTVYTRITGQMVPQNLGPVTLPKSFYKNKNEARDVSVNKNSNIQASLAAIRSGMAGRDVNRANFAPRVGIDAGPSYNDVGRSGKNYQLSWTAMMNMQWNMYNGGADTATFKADSAKIRRLRYELHDVMDLVNQELGFAFSVIRSSDSQVRSYANAAKASRLAKLNYYKQFELGEKDLLSVLDAESEYFFSLTEEAVHRTDAILGRYRVLALTGDLLDEMGLDRGSLQQNIPHPDSETPWDFSPTTLDEKKALQGTTLTQRQ